MIEHPVERIPSALVAPELRSVVDVIGHGYAAITRCDEEFLGRMSRPIAQRERDPCHVDVVDVGEELIGIELFRFEVGE
jgi:hypothetical protein